MRILKPLLLFISIYVAFVGCSKKNDPVAPCYISTITNVYGSYNDVETYTYADNKVISVSSVTNGVSSGTLNYSYDAQGRLTSITSVLGSFNETFSYDTNGNLIQIISPDSKTVYTYNSSNQRIKMEEYSYSNSAYKLGYYAVYTYPSTSTKNYSTQTYFDGSNSQQNTLTFVYDTKQNPQAVLSAGRPETTNNVTQVSSQNPGSNAPSVSTYTYTYNSNGFPLTIKNGPYTTTYTYTNCK